VAAGAAVMASISAQATAKALLLFAVVVLLSAFILFLVARYRGDEEQGQPAASSLLTKFREMHGRGELSDEEFRTIKTQLSARLEQELNESDGTG